MIGRSSSLGMIRSLGIGRRRVEVGLVQALLERDAVAQGRQSAHDGALAERDEDLAVLAEGPQDLDVLAVAAAALDEADVDGLGERLDVVDRRLVELDQLEELEDALVDVEDGHVTAETSGQRRGGDDGLAHGLTSPRPSRRRRRSGRGRICAGRSARRSRSPSSGWPRRGRRPWPCGPPPRRASRPASGPPRSSCGGPGRPRRRPSGRPWP